MWVLVVAAAVVALAGTAAAQEVCEPYTDGCTPGTGLPTVPPSTTVKAPRDGDPPAPPSQGGVGSGGGATTPLAPVTLPSPPAAVDAGAGGGALPVTGADVAGLAALAAILIAGGLVLARTGRGRTGP